MFNVAGGRGLKKSGGAKLYLVCFESGRFFGVGARRFAEKTEVCQTKNWHFVEEELGLEELGTIMQILWVGQPMSYPTDKMEGMLENNNKGDRCPYCLAPKPIALGGLFQSASRRRADAIAGRAWRRHHHALWRPKIVLPPCCSFTSGRRVPPPWRCLSAGWGWLLADFHFFPLVSTCSRGFHNKKLLGAPGISPGGFRAGAT